MKLLAPVTVGLTFLAAAFTALPPLVVEWARHGSPGVVYYADTSEPVVGLSIDDGPSGATPEILDVLDRHDAACPGSVPGATGSCRCPSC